MGTVVGAWVGAKVVVTRVAVTAVVARAQAAMLAEAMEEARVEALAEARVAVATAAKVEVATEVAMEVVMVAVVQEAVAAAERVEEAKAMVETGVVQEWGCVAAGALLPDALHGSAERVVVARAGLAHQPEHHRLGLGLGHAAGTHRDGSSRPSVQALRSSFPGESVAGANKRDTSS